MFDVTTYGATGDGSTDDREAIQDAIDACELAGGGVVYFPKGTYLLDSSVLVDAPDDDPTCLIVDGNNVKLRGDGVGVSVLKLGDNINSHMIIFGTAANSVDSPGVRDLEFDGNQANQTANAHGIRSGGTVTGLKIQDVYIHDIVSYAIGLQFGTIQDCVIDTVLIEDTGADGIDIKNPNHNNRNNYMNKVTVRRAGLRTDLVDQACIDVRGIWTLNSIVCEEFNNSTNRCQAGIRFRQSSAEATGAHHSSLSNFTCRASSSTDTVGVEVSAYQVQITAGYVESCGVGVRINQSEVTASSIVAKLCVDGYYVNNSVSMETSGDRFTGSSLVAKGCSGKGFLISGDYAVLSGLIAFNNARGIHVGTPANHTTVSGVLSGNTTNYVNNGTNTHNDLSVY